MRVQIYTADHNGQEYRVEGTGLQTFLQYDAAAGVSAMLGLTALGIGGICS